MNPPNWIHSTFEWREDFAARRIRRRELWQRFFAMITVAILIQMACLAVIGSVLQTSLLAEDNLAAFALVVISIVFVSLHFQPMLAGRCLDLGFSDKWPRKAHQLALIPLALIVIAGILAAIGSEQTELTALLAFFSAMPSLLMLALGLCFGLLPSKAETRLEATP